jgi:hypothetical protein
MNCPKYTLLKESQSEHEDEDGDVGIFKMSLRELNIIPQMGALSQFFSSFNSRQRLLPRLPVNSITPFNFSSITCLEITYL